MVHDGDPVAEIVRLFHVVGRQDDRHPALFIELFDIIPNKAPGLGVEAEGGLVQKKDLRPMDQSPGDLQPPLHPPGIFLDENRGFLCQVDQLQDQIDPSSPLLPLDVVHHRMKIEVLFSGELAVKGGLLEDDADAFPDAVPALGHVETGDLSESRRRFEKGGQHVDRGRLAGAVRPEKPEQLTLWDGKGDMVHSRQAVELLGQILDPDRIHRFTPTGLCMIA